jgi:hypothetical protein
VQGILIKKFMLCRSNKTAQSKGVNTLRGKQKSINKQMKKEGRKERKKERSKGRLIK